MIDVLEQQGQSISQLEESVEGLHGIQKQGSELMELVSGNQKQMTEFMEDVQSELPGRLGQPPPVGPRPGRGRG